MQSTHIPDAPGSEITLEWLTAALGARPGGVSGLKPKAVHKIQPGKSVFRIAVEGTEYTSLILKLVDAVEAKTHTTLGNHLADVSPRIHGKLQAPGGRICLMMEDLGEQHRQGIGSEPDQFAVYQGAIEQLALVHSYFDQRGRAVFPDLPAVDYQLAAENARELPQLLDVMVEICGVPIESAALKEAGAISCRLQEYVRGCASAGPETLVHCDFHPMNIMRNAEGQFRILDWGTAGIGIPEWDLVLCGRSHITAYLARREELKESEFVDRLRCAIVLRMFRFLHVSIGLAVADSHAQAEALLRAIPLHVTRLIEAANSESFLGLCARQDVL